MVLAEMIKSAPSVGYQSVTQTKQSTWTTTDLITTGPARIDSVVVGHLSIVLDQVDDEFVATDLQTGMYGEGDTEDLAIASLVQSLRDLRDTLRGHEGRMAPDLAADLEYLNRIL